MATATATTADQSATATITAQQAATPPPPLGRQQIFAARAAILGLHMAPAVEEYIVQLALATRGDGPLGRWIDYGVSPRATIGLDRAARAHAWLAGRDFVAPDDVQAMLADVFRHRLILNYDAEAAGITPDRVIDELLAAVPVG